MRSIPFFLIITLLYSCASTEQQVLDKCDHLANTNIDILNHCLNSKKWKNLKYHAEKMVTKNRRTAFYFLSLYYMQLNKKKMSLWYIEQVLTGKANDPDVFLFQKAQILWAMSKKQEAYAIFKILSARGFQPAHSILAVSKIEVAKK